MNEELAAVIQKYRRNPAFENVNDVNQHAIDGDTLLHAAVVGRDLRDVELLISLGADVNAVGDLGNTPLHHAASRGLESFIKALLRAKANVSIKNEFGQTAYDLAEVMGHKDAARLLKRGF